MALIKNSPKWLRIGIGIIALGAMTQFPAFAPLIAAVQEALLGSETISAPVQP